MSDDQSPPLIARARRFASRTALIDDRGAYTYQALLDASSRAAAALLDGRSDLAEARVAFVTAPGISYVTTQWGVWRGGGLATPLCTAHPPAEWRYVLDDAGVSILVADRDFADTVIPLARAAGVRLIWTDELTAAAPVPLPRVDPPRRAMMLYTSGTTGKPKGVVTTHANIAAQIESLVQAWRWSADDRILHVLPLHHIHGVVNVLGCSLWSGALCRVLPRFDADRVWRC